MAQITLTELWNVVESNFSTNDGSLPCIEIHELSAIEVGTIYSRIRKQSQITSEEPMFWDNVLETDRHLDTVPNAGLLVPSGEAAPFHFSVQSIYINKVELPCIGVYIFQDIVALDYRMGNEWQPLQVWAFFLWLKEMLEGTNNGILLPSANDGPPNPIAFFEAWKKFYFA